MRFNIYLATFFFTLHYAFLLYINSSFLGQIFSEFTINALYTAGALLAIAGLARASGAIKQYGLYNITLTLLGMGFFASISLGFTQTPVLVAGLFLILNALAVLLRYATDLYLEATSTDKETGFIRGVQLTVINIAIAGSPFIVGKLVTSNGFPLIYTIAGLLLLPTIYLVASKPAMARTITARHEPFWKTIRRVRSNANIYNIFASNFLLEFFYAWMVIYLPLHLSRDIGFTWNEIGIIFSIMLIPFVIFELPLGRLADKFFGEKELLVIGFFMLALFTGSLAFIETPSMILWATILFMTRIGAATVEIMTESYFFKQVSIKDADEISIFRDSRPLAFIIAPALASGLLFFTDISGLFIALAVIQLGGIWFALGIRDTR